MLEKQWKPKLMSSGWRGRSSHPEACKVDLPLHSGAANGQRGRGRFPGEQHEHGSERCVMAFLGQTNWEHKIHNLFALP